MYVIFVPRCLSTEPAANDKYHTKPNVQYETKHPVFPVLQDIGREITQKVKPKAVVVFSGHWEGSPDTIEVNTAEHTDLIYE